MGGGEGEHNAEWGVRNAEFAMEGRVRTLRIPHSALRILAALWRLNLAEELQYRANFVASVLGTVFWIGTALLTLALFFRHTTRLGGWDYWEVVVLLGVFNARSEEHTSELQSLRHLVCRLLLEKKKQKQQ